MGNRFGSSCGPARIGPLVAGPPHRSRGSQTPTRGRPTHQCQGTSTSASPRIDAGKGAERRHPLVGPSPWPRRRGGEARRHPLCDRFSPRPPIPPSRMAVRYLAVRSPGVWRRQLECSALRSLQSGEQSGRLLASVRLGVPRGRLDGSRPLEVATPLSCAVKAWLHPASVRDVAGTSPPLTVVAGWPVARMPTRLCQSPPRLSTG